MYGNCNARKSPVTLHTRFELAYAGERSDFRYLCLCYELVQFHERYFLPILFIGRIEAHLIRILGKQPFLIRWILPIPFFLVPMGSLNTFSQLREGLSECIM